MSNLKNTIIDNSDYIYYPTGDTSQRPVIPQMGMMRYNTDLEVFEFYNGYIWTGFKQIGESGKINCSSTIDDGVVVNINFNTKYQNPIVVAFIPTRGGGQSIDARVKNLSSFGCDIFVQEPDNQAHASETVCYFVFEQGVHELEDGVYIEANSLTTSSVHRSPNSFDGPTVSFQAPFNSTPALLATLNTHNNNTFMSSISHNLSSSSFQLQQEAGQSGVSATTETIGWVAFTRGYFSQYEAENVIDGSDDGVGDLSPQIINFVRDFNSIPDVIVNGVTGNGADGYWARGSGTYSSSEIQVYAEEDQVGDSERNHFNEEFSYVATTPNTRFYKFKF